ncbi:TRAP transporter small permease [Roseibaca sp. Y0-43]|nr:TRAP transporter small permease [Roseibaca sp. Y0-43]
MAAIAFAAALLFTSVLARTFLGTSIPDDVVLAENLMPLIVTLPLAYVAARRGHIEVEVFTNFLPFRTRTALTLCGNLIGLLLFGLIAWSAFNVALSDFQRGRFYEGVLQIPQWPAKAFFVAGLALLSARLVLNTAQDLATLVKGGRNAG